MQRPAVEFTDEERDTLNTVVEQLGVALESARLYESSQVQAERQRLVGEVAARLQESLDVEAVLRTAAQEIRSTLDLKEVTIVLEQEKV